MTRLINRIEKMFEGYARFAFSRRWLVLLVSLLLLGGLFSQLPKIRFDTSTEGFFRDTDPTLKVYNQFREQFGRDEMVIMAIKPKDVFDPGFLRTLRDYHRELEARVPHVKDITSMINARLTLGRGEELVVKELLEDWPDTPEKLANLKTLVMGNPIYLDALISADGRFTTVVIKTQSFSAGDQQVSLESGFDAENQKPLAPRVPLTDQENSEIVEAVRSVNQKYNSAAFPIAMAGSPVVTDFLKKAMQQDMRKFLGIAVLVIGVFLFLLFRRVSGVVFPLLVVLLSLLATVSLMAAFQVPLKTPSAILPSFLLAVGVGSSVHIMTIFLRRFDQSGDRRDAMVYALGHSGLPVVMTGLTTAVGLGSFMSAEVGAIAELGMFAGAGVLLGMVMTILLLPNLIAFTPMRPAPVRTGKATVMDRFLGWLGGFASRHPWPIVLISAGLLVVSLIGATRLNFSHNTLRWFPEDSEIRVATEQIDRELKGSLTIEFLIDSGVENGLYDVELLNRMEIFRKSLLDSQGGNGTIPIGKTMSIVDVLKEINKALNENRDSHSRIPQSRKLIAQELLLFENSGSDDLEDIVDSQFRLARFSARVPWEDAATYVKSLDHLEASAKKIFEGKAEIQVTGIITLFTRSINAMMHSTVTSYLIAGVMIALLMILMMRSIGYGLLGMVPNLTPIILVLGLMGWTGIRLDMFSLLIGSIAIGLAVDDTIHFMHNYIRYHREGLSPTQAIHETLMGTGRAMVITSVVLVSGFWLFIFATINNLVNFGLLTGLALAFALFFTLMLLPALLVLVSKTNTRASS